MASFQICPASA